METRRRLMDLVLSFFVIAGFSISATTSGAWKTDGHPNITDFALDVLSDDNYTYLVSYLIDSGSLDRMKKAVTNCDRLDLAVNHYYNPITGEGLAGATLANEVAQTFFNKAISSYEDGDVGTAWYYFGWSLHVVQDLMVPFHSHLDPLNGHTAFEQFVYDNRFFYPPPDDGVYEAASNASLWVEYSAEFSYPYYDGISGDNATEENFDAAATILFPEAIGLTAGYIKFFADKVGVGDFNLYMVRRGMNFVKVGWDESIDEGFQSYELYVSDEKDEVFSGDPYAVFYDRGLTEKTVTGLELGEEYYFKMKAVCNGSSHHSNLLKASPQWPLVFFLIPGMTTVVAIVILLSKKHRRPRKVKK